MSPRAFPHQHLLAVTHGTGPNILLEHADHPDRAAEPALPRHHSDLLARLAKHPLRPPHPPQVDLVQDRPTEILLKLRLQPALRRRHRPRDVSIAAAHTRRAADP